MPNHRPQERMVMLLCLIVAPPSLSMSSALFPDRAPTVWQFALCAHGTAWRLYPGCWTHWVGGVGWWWNPCPRGHTGLENWPAPASWSTTRALGLKTSLRGRKSFLPSTSNPLCFSLYPLYPFLLRSREGRVSGHQLWAKTPHLLEFFSLLPASVPQ